ncbi:MAG: hypothetical protein CMJ83_05465 [Planctomycetes bacterium]|nr:hypothetical protein [Planctomycetota bacterium]
MSGHSVWMAIGWTMVHFLWIGALVALGASLVARSVRRARPEVRYVAALAGFVAFAISPVFIFAWVLSDDMHPTAGVVHAPIPFAPGESAVRPGPAGTAASFPAASAEAGGAASDGVAQVVGWLPWFWMVGAGLAFALVATGVLGSRRLSGGGTLVEKGPLARALASARKLLGVTRTVRVATSDGVGGPVVVGIFKPIVLLPASALSGLTPEAVEMILLHELAHVRRLDNLVNLLQRIVESALFFHPAVWVLSRRVRREREHCCDAVVLRHRREPHAYVRTLLTLCDVTSDRRAASMAAAMAGHDVVERVRRILNQEPSNMPLSPRWFGVFGVATCLAALTLSLSGGHTDSAALAQMSIPESRFVSTQAPASLDPPDCWRTPDGGPTDCKSCHMPSVHQHRADPRLEKLGMSITDCAACHQPAKNRKPLGVHKALGIVDPLPVPNWAPAQATGAPDTPKAGDHPTAWASLTPDGQDEWLELTWKKAVEPISINVYNTYNPGALIRVWAWDAHGQKKLIWEGRDDGRGQSWITVVKVKRKILTRRVCIELASKRVKGWNEIDAVGLVDGKSKVHWASGAKASSTFASVNANGFRTIRFDTEVARLSPHRAPRFRSTERVIKLQKQLEETKKQLEKAQKRLSELERAMKKRGRVSR